MEKTNFERLRVFRLAEQLADEVWDIVGGGNQFAKNTVGEQLVDVADSIGANTAEGAGRGSFQQPGSARIVRAEAREKRAPAG